MYSPAIRPKTSNLEGDLPQEAKQPKRTVGDWFQNAMTFLGGLSNNAAQIYTASVTPPVTNDPYTQKKDPTPYLIIGALAIGALFFFNRK